MSKITRAKLKTDIVEHISGSISFNHSPTAFNKGSIYQGISGYSLVVESNEQKSDKRILVLNVFAANSFTNRLAKIVITYKRSKNASVEITID